MKTDIYYRKIANQLVDLLVNTMWQIYYVILADLVNNVVTYFFFAGIPISIFFNFFLYKRFLTIINKTTSFDSSSIYIDRTFFILYIFFLFLPSATDCIHVIQ